MTTPTACVWLDKERKPIACEEKLRVLNNALQEVNVYCQDMLDDAVLMGCSEDFVREVLRNMVSSLRSQFAPLA